LPLANDRHYRAMGDFMNKLLDRVGARETHQLMGLLDIVAPFVQLATPCTPMQVRYRPGTEVLLRCWIQAALDNCLRNKQTGNSPKSSPKSRLRDFYISIAMRLDVFRRLERHQWGCRPRSP
jgi:hypothetical protein